MVSLILSLLLSHSNAQAAISSAAGADLGGNATFLFSDPSIQAFGLGAGYQGSAFLSMWNNKPIGGKLRIESMALREEALQKSSTDYIYPGTQLKSMTQRWLNFGVGAEGRFSGHGQIFFWEALLGYAFSQGGTVAVSTARADQPVYENGYSLRSAFSLSGGIGIKRNFHQKIVGIMSLRTMFLMGTPYTSSELANKSFIPFPILFSIGAETPFEWF